MLSEELRNALESQDDINEQFEKTWPLVADGASHLCRAPIGEHAAIIGSTVFKAYYRYAYRLRENFGGIIFVSRNEAVLTALRYYIAAFLALRENSFTEVKADAACFSLRSSKDAVPFYANMMIYGLPFDGLMSWDVSNILGCCTPMESFFFATLDPDKWDVRATGAGEVLRLEDRVQAVFNIDNAIRQLKK